MISDRVKSLLTRIEIFVHFLWHQKLQRVCLQFDFTSANVARFKEITIS